MRLATLQEYRSTYFTPESAPSMATLRRNIHRLPGGCRVLGRYYVDLDEVDRVHKLHAAVDQRLAELAGNPLLDGLV